MKNKIIAYEVDLQNDFMNEKNGRLYVPGAELIKPTTADVVRFVLDKKLRRVRSRDRHFADDLELAENKGPFPQHCMDEKYGQKNDNAFGLDFIPELQANNKYVIENKIDEGDNFKKYTQQELKAIAEAKGDILLEKQDNDAFTNPATEQLLKLLGAKQAIVYGVATDYCVKAAVVGMQQRGIQCYVVEDAIAGVDKETTEAARKEIIKAGAKFVVANDLERLMK